MDEEKLKDAIDDRNQIDVKNNIEKKGRDLDEQKEKKGSSKPEVPVVDKDTVVEKAVAEQETDMGLDTQCNEEQEIKEEKEILEEAGSKKEESDNSQDKETSSTDELLNMSFDEEHKEEPDALESYLENSQDTDKKKKWSWKKKLLVVLCVLGLLIGGGCAVFYTMLNRIDRERPEDIKRAHTDLSPEELAAQQATLRPQEFNNKIEQKVVNILLVGEEAINDGVLGRSDSMMVATLNTVEKTIKLTSLMRDMYVTIPGYRDNKLNAAYHNGGGVLLAETIEQNFGIEIDGYVRVNFDAFEKIVDELGGVEITLTGDEAHYLQTTNYISKKSNRNVVEGKQILNGNQALGYCRVRYKTASNGEANDFGRTYRQRTVLKAIFDKYKHQNVVNMVSIASDMLSYVTTNLSKSEMLSYLTTAASFGTLELETFRIPLDNTYDGTKIDGKSVLVIDFDANKQALREFIYAGIADSEIKVESGDMEDDRYFSYLWTD
ncbi:LCP family protein [[Clostridium] polysaccharolyticum]|uniref:Transcriptional attenuator, LytR family n=1 Tax=[Clostridium] polysaccharolyticum TaxID=29364 RepID=A0A1I0C722_9FIRM|nr:LCP family protein [[Clostridium] polysaccharolyticum]SET15238.1 transcriptional attenuator, LytR family [[Clostridium] polysaccharolyticum]